MNIGFRLLIALCCLVAVQSWYMHQQSISAIYEDLLKGPIDSA